MRLYEHLSIYWYKHMGRKSKAHYISNHITSVRELNKSQKNSAQKAIIWVLAKAPHTAEEIADHFDLTPALVTQLLVELIKTGKIKRIKTSPPKFKLREKAALPV